MSYQNSSVQIAVDIISNEYKTTDPLIIHEKIKTDLNMSITIHQILDYFDVIKNAPPKQVEKPSYYSIKNN